MLYTNEMDEVGSIQLEQWERERFFIVNNLEQRDVFLALIHSERVKQREREKEIQAFYRFLQGFNHPQIYLFPFFARARMQTQRLEESWNLRIACYVKYFLDGMVKRRQHEQKRPSLFRGERNKDTRTWVVFPRCFLLTLSQFDILSIGDRRPFVFRHCVRTCLHKFCNNNDFAFYRYVSSYDSAAAGATY